MKQRIHKFSFTENKILVVREKSLLLVSVVSVEYGGLELKMNEANCSWMNLVTMRFF